MYHLHITAITRAYEKEIARGLIQLGYMISPASDLGLPVSSTKIAGQLISFQISNEYKVDSVAIYGDVRSVLDNMHAQYYSVIISAFTYDSLWVGGNFELISSEDKRLLN